jgi:predicted ATPase
MARRSKSPGAGPYVESLEVLWDRVPSRTTYPFNIPAVSGLTSLDLHPRVTFVIGENGTGKSTLVEGIAVAFGLNAEGGSRNFRFSTFESHSTLGEALRLVKTWRTCRASYFLRAETFYNVATEIASTDLLVWHYDGESFHEQSHGESFLTLFEKRFHGPGFFLADEPEAALSPTRQLVFLRLLHESCGRRSQWVIATHSPIIMAYPDSWIYEIGDQGPHRVEYEQTDHYVVTRGFLANPKRSLDELLSDNDEVVGNS